LRPGTRLGVYEITAAIGAGGMGEVYRARDTKLNRDVALKVLPPSVAADPERIARFEREAKTLAALNHPNIAHIHGLEESDAIRAIVMELVDGPTLADRIAQGPIPLDEALPIAKQIAEALEAAHEQAIIHRDLKPANVKVRDDGTVKVLDFGLAKVFDTTATPNPSVTQSPTITTPAMMTGVGMILGTAAYMSPEQAKGRPADKRSDIWAFGCVLYEMLTGARAFPGDDLSETLAAVIKSEPAWVALPTDTPSSIHKVLRRCLEKDRKRRLDSIADARLEIEDGLPDARSTLEATSPRRVGSTAIAMALIGGSLVTALGMWLVMRPTAAPPRPIRFTIVPPAAQPLALSDNIALSPDGTHLVYAVGPQRQLMIRALDQLEAVPLRGATGARFPFFSPDGRWVGFHAPNEIRRTLIAGGAPVTVCRTYGGFRGATWGPDDTIIFATSDPSTGLLRVPAAGGEPQVLTKPQSGKEDHFYPTVLPDGRAVLFSRVPAGPNELAMVAVLDLSTGREKTLIRGGTRPAYVDSGYLIYAFGDALQAVHFDRRRLDVVSNPVPVVEQVAAWDIGTAAFAVSRAGTLVYVPSTVGVQAASRSLVWVDRKGREEPIPAPPRGYFYPRLSPDGTRIAVDIRDQERDIWIWDFGKQTLQRLTQDPANDWFPVWTPDGTRLVFASDRGGAMNLFRQSADGTGNVERLTTSSDIQWPFSFTPDGNRLLMLDQTPKTGFDLSLLLLNGTPRIEPLIRTSANETNGDISPDGKWLAYQSNESGQDRVFVRPFPNISGGVWQISADAGTRPLWARDGRELFFIDGSGRLTAVSIETTPTFSRGNPAQAVERSYFMGATTGRTYDVSRDGQRFLMVKETGGDGQNSTPASLIVVLNWIEELKARVPVK
jgi:eukaryotic-like serine/threonine-protein kinase